MSSYDRVGLSCRSAAAVYSRLASHPLSSWVILSMPFCCRGAGSPDAGHHLQILDFTWFPGAEAGPLGLCGQVPFLALVDVFAITPTSHLENRGTEMSNHLLDIDAEERGCMRPESQPKPLMIPRCQRATGGCCRVSAVNAHLWPIAAHNGSFPLEGQIHVQKHSAAQAGWH